MTQQKIIETLDELMPQIASTKDPEAVLLKFAKTNNLYPTQVEKLGHAFNQCKTLVGLQKQANRGDSFTLLDVPAMVKKYASYNPAEVLSKKEKEVHKKVNKIVKSASVLDTPEERIPLPNFLEDLKFKGAEIETNNVSEYDLSNSSGNFDVTFNKAASAEDPDKLSLLKEAHESIKTALKKASQAKQGTREIVRIKCANIVDTLRVKGPQAWAEIVEDVVYRYGAEKSAAAIDAVENYLEINHIPYQVADLTKKAYSYSLSKDRHNMFAVIEDIMQATDLYKSAASVLSSLEKDDSNMKNYISEFIKQAKPKGSAKNNPPNSNKKEKEVYVKNTSDIFDSNKDALNFTKNTVDTAVRLPKAVLMDAPTEALKDFNTYADNVSKLLPDKDKYQKTYDKETSKLNKEFALQQVLLSDPIISEADPREVQELYTTISSISPRFAQDPRMMSTALKEALQYGAVPVSMLKDIADFEDKMNKARLNESTYLSNKYRV